MSRGRVLSKVGGLTQTIAGISTFVGVSTFASDVRLHGNLTVDGTTTLSTAIANSNLANSTVSFGGVSVALGAADATPAFNLSDATSYPTSSLSGTITNAQLAGSIANDKLAGSIANDKLAGSIANNKLANSTVSYGGISLALGASDATPAFDLTDATNYPTSSLTGTITNAQLAGSIAASKLAGSIGNAKLSNSSITVTDGSNSTATALGGTITFSGTGNEVEVAESSGTITVGLPNNVTIGNNLTVTGNLQVDGTTTTINTATMTVEDKNIEIAKGAANDAAADGAGITVDSGDGDKTWNWVDSTDSWTSSEHINLASGKGFKLNGTTVLSGTTLGSSIVSSSLTSVGTITSGVWNGTAIANANLANSTVSFGGISLALGASDATPAFDLTDATNYPTSSLSGTITNAQLAGSIANAKLANSTVSFGGISLALGGTDATPAFNLADATGLPISTGVSGLASNVATFLGTPSSANLRSILTDETGTGAAVFAASPSLTGDITLTDTTADDAAGPEFKMYRNSASPADADYLGQIKFAGESDTSVERNYAKITGKILDASNGSEDGAIEFSHIKGGSQVITGRFRSDSFQLLNGTGLAVNGAITTDSTVDGRDVAADGTKLDGIESSATADQTAAEIRTLVESASDSNVFTDADHSKLNAIEASATADQTDAEIRAAVEAATDSNVFTDADHTKLNGIEASATADQTDEEIQDIVGAMLTGNTESGITVTYQDGDGTIDFAVASQTDQNFTNADHTKLDGIETSATADQTGAEIKSLYEAESDTNAFTDADHTKLDGIEASATADQTAAEIRTLVDGATDSNVLTDTLLSKLNAIEASATADQTDEEIQDIVGAMLTGNTESGITVTYQDADGTIDFTVASQTDENFTTADHAKLDGIEASATADQTAAEIRTLTDSASDSNVFTDALLSKLNGIEASATADQTSEEIQDIVGAMVGGAVESGITVSYDDTDGQLDFQVASQTDENFTTADHAKLDGIEASATADQTASEILTLIKTVDGAGSGLDADTLDGISSASFLRSDTSDTFTGTLTVSGAAAVDNLSLNGNTVTTSSGNLTISSTGGTTTMSDNVAISGNLTVNGTTTTVNATTVNIADKNIQVATGAADDSAADGGGITVDSGDGDKTFQFEATGDNFGSSENMNLASGKAYKINNTSVLNATTLGSNVVASSLTSVGTLTGLTVSGDTTFDSSAGSDYDIVWTTSNGQLRIKDSSKLVFGSSGAVSVYHDGSDYNIANFSGDTYISNTDDIYLRVNNTESALKAVKNGAVELYHNGTKKIETSSTGGTVSGTLVATSFTGALTGNVTGNASGSSGSCTGNAATATALANARTIAGVSFDGTGNISLNNNAITNGAGYITSSGTSAACSGNAATATALANARTIAGVSFDGTANISLNNNAITNGAGYITSSGTSAACSGNAATATLASTSTITANNSTDETVYPVFVDGATGTQGLESDTGLSYNPSSGNLTSTRFVGAVTGNVTGNASGSSGSCTGNAATATKLANARTIAGVSFDGTGNISLNNNAITNGAGYVTSNTQLSNEQVQDIVGAMVTGNTESGITVTYQDGDGTIDFSVTSQTDNNFTNSDHSKLDGIESGATADQSASEILTLIKTVDGSGSGLDADTLDGVSSGSFLRSDTADTMTATLTCRAITPQADSTYNLGTDSVRWSNIYGDNIRTGDLHLSNEHRGGNDVDGTWGDFTIQEGEEDLFLMNKRSGKKYRFLLQQV